MGNARARKIPARLVEDEDYQLRHERVAGIDVAKAKADVCTRLPPGPRRRAARRRGSRRSPRGPGRSWTLAARLLADGVELVVMESTSDYWRIWFYLLEARGPGRAAGELLPRPAAGRQAEDRPARRPVDRPAGRDGPAAPVFVPPPEIRALRDLTRTRLQLVRDRTREWQRLEKLLEGALVKLSSALLVAGPDEDRPRHPGGHRRRRARPRRPWPRWPHAHVKGGRAAIEQVPGRHGARRPPPHADPGPPGPHHPPGPDGRRARGRDRGRPGRHPRRLGHQTPTARRARTPAPAPRPCPPRSGSRRSPASASSSPGRSSPRRAWT